MCDRFVGFTFFEKCFSKIFFPLWKIFDDFNLNFEKAERLDSSEVRESQQKKKNMDSVNRPSIGMDHFFRK